MRLLFAAISAFVEAHFYRTITEEINPHVGRYVFVALFFSAGMFNAATGKWTCSRKEEGNPYDNHALSPTSLAFLPSTFAMWTTFMAYSYILRPPYQISHKRTYRAVFCLGLGALLGWPFSAVVGIPFAVEEILEYGRDGAFDARGRAVALVRPDNWRKQRVIRLARAIAVCALGISVS